MFTPLTIAATIHAPLAQVWQRYTTPEFIMQWNQASPDWHCPSATNDLRVGGTFTSRMEAKDGSFGFDFGGTYTDVEPMERIAYVLGDGRKVVVTFAETDLGTQVVIVFDAEGENSLDMQRSGWQSILDNFKRCAEGA
ncbi:polyketide cyclase [Candidatus Gracilibacteria bacterium CG17_big_fil_post_rev_8_21_14_2_50_48_13]|nr:MAG: polyketide cyclase [Candidatus Gracilibacteria bacterium CG17_big_fil_post_rev_8_21_14_2_50_48_13]